MNKKLKYAGIVIVMVLTFGLTQYAAAKELIVIASKETQKSAQDWLGFLESKEIPVKLVAPDAFSDIKNELYIMILGSLDESNEIREIAKDALTADEFNSLSTEGKMFYKPQAWNVGQKVFLFLGPNLESSIDARINSQEEWYAKLQEWFEIEDTAGFHLY
jgi:hypothetical protein